MPALVDARITHGVRHVSRGIEGIDELETRVCSAMNRALVFALLVACSSKKSDPAPTPAPAPATPVAKPATPSKPAAGSGSGSGSSTIESPAQVAAYHTAMRDGRKATDAKNYAAAIAAFDKALVAKRADSRALAERGYARLLDGKDLVAASRDLDAASGTTKDPKLLSMIWFNRGLVEEARKDEPNALAAFTIANTLHPNDAAKAKLAGKSSCAATVVKPFAVEGAKITDGADWVALAKAIAPPDEPATIDPPAALPAVFTIHHSMMDYMFLAVKQGAGIRAYPLGGAFIGHCNGRVAFAIASSTDHRVVVHGTEVLQPGYTWECVLPGGTQGPCTGADGEDWAHTICDEGGAVVRDVIIDLATDAMTAVEQPDENHFATVKVDASGIHLGGNGCDGTR